MEESDRQFIAELFRRQEERLEERFATLEERFATQEERFRKHEDKIQHSLDLFVNHIDVKIGLLGEGQQMLAERLDRVEHELKQEIGKVDLRVTRLAADLSAHRADTEAHHGVYRVKES